MPSINFESTFWIGKKVLVDSRKLLYPAKTIFFALAGKYHHGNLFIGDLYEQGVRCFVTDSSRYEDRYIDAEFVVVSSPLALLQTYAAWHRSQLDYPVIAITGSNGKTIVKEWLFQLLNKDFLVVKSPKSYNSQIGVPLSILEMEARHNLGVFEAGISQPKEMSELKKIIKPTIGIFTNIGEAHDEGFESREQKIAEKLELFKDCPVLIYPCKYKELDNVIEQLNNQELYSWGNSWDAKIPTFVKFRGNGAIVELYWMQQKHIFQLPFVSEAAIENSIHCIITLLYLGFDLEQIQQRLERLRDVARRLELKVGANHCTIIDDSYNNDWAGLQIALNFLRQKHEHHSAVVQTVILSDLLESGIAEEQLYQKVADLLTHYKINKFIGVGEAISRQKACFEQIKEVHFFEETSALLNSLELDLKLREETILVKGARVFEFEKVVHHLCEQLHDTVLEIDLEALAHNFNFYRSLLKPSTKMMVMVKAFAYGSDGYEVARLLQYHYADYLGVAYTDEAVALRQRGIHLPIMIMNVSTQHFGQLLRDNLEPVIYNFRILESFIKFLEGQKGTTIHPIHIELDTGMHRLGFDLDDLEKLSKLLNQRKNRVKVVSVFSHLAGSDEAIHDGFSNRQLASFEQFANGLEQNLGCQLIKHMLNSAGISRFLPKQFDMVRLGIGLHGIDPQYKDQLQVTSTLKTTISQIRILEAGQTVGYSRKGKLTEPSKIATLAIGYADGYLRAFGNGVGHVSINGSLVPIVGNICMDMCFVDVTDIDAQEGDEVIIFGELPTIETLARAIGTIPYEILTNISQRVPRVFFEA
ncbi:MAG: bifunctional UDP-N-acetylmuramoyl-tripeptide:D-alanyl-D-alanine ligase/alanine racemase [Aureispira sp.]|nr:bifunctional UDP-N-acetylmuramoyl-tripeptide:D-alanyl-D-alanine ligase/alanine racemase [Aureispira sp.]